MTLASLEARLIAATGPDREIDALLQRAFLTPNTVVHVGCAGETNAFTKSIDAIGALIRRSGWHWGVNSVGEAVVYETATRDVPRYVAHCPTPELALCLTYVRAMRAKGEAEIVSKRPCE